MPIAKLRHPQFAVPKFVFPPRPMPMEPEHEELVRQALALREQGLPLPEELRSPIHIALLHVYHRPRRVPVAFWGDVESICHWTPAVMQDPDRFRRAYLYKHGLSTPEQVHEHLRQLKRAIPLAAVLIPPGAFEGV